MFVLSECHFTIRQTAKNLFALLVCPFHPPVGLKQDRGGGLTVATLVVIQTQDRYSSRHQSAAVQTVV